MRPILLALKWILLPLLSIVLSLYFILLLINLQDKPPSEQSLLNHTAIEKSERILAQHLDNNGYVFALGFDVAQDALPMTAGLKRLQKHQNVSTMEREGVVKASSYEIPPLPLENCLSQQDYLSACEARLASSENIQTLLGEYHWLIERYRQLISTGTWYDSANFNIYNNTPAYSKILTAQKLYLLNLFQDQSTQQGSQILQSLDSDMQFWLEVSSNTHQLLTKAISISAIKSSMQMGELILIKSSSRFKDPVSALPQSWLQPMPGAVLSIENAKLGEWQYLNALFASLNTNEGDMPLPLTEQISTWLLSSLMQSQDAANLYATMLQSSEASRQCREGLSLDTVLYFAYNPVGKILLCTGIPSFGSYQKQTQELEQLRQTLVQRRDDNMKTTTY